MEPELTENILNMPAERDAQAKRQVVSGLGYPAGRDEKSPEKTGWMASGPDSNAPGAKGKLEKVSRGTSA